MLADLEESCGNRQIVIGRELTKMFEEVLRGTVSELRALLHERKIKGEVSLLVAGQRTEERQEEQPQLAEEIRLLEIEGLSLKEIAQVISARHGIPKREVYALGVELREGGKE